MVNFNYTNREEYTLHRSCTEEMIDLYGVPTKFLVTEKINIDDNVFGDFSHMKTNSDSIYEFYTLPENSDDWDSTGYTVTEFGLSNFENIVLFVAQSNFDGIIAEKEIVGNLLIFPNNKIMEISDVDLVVPGINNLYTYDDTKSVYKFSCVPYKVKLTDELDTTDISADENPYTELDGYFDELIDTASDQDDEAQVTPQRTTVEEDGDNDTQVEKPIIDPSESNVWGQWE